MFYESPFNSPFVVPVAGCAMVLGIVVAGAWTGLQQRRVQSEERLAAIAAGVPIPPTPEELAILHGKPTRDSKRLHGNIRLTGIVLLSAAVGMILFFVVLAAILRQREVLAGAAVGLVPLAIGVGFMIDARLKARELAEEAASLTSGREMGAGGLRPLS